MALLRRQNARLRFALGLWLAFACGWAEAQAGAPSVASPSTSSATSSANQGPSSGPVQVNVQVKQLGSIRQIEGARLLLATDQEGEVPVRVQPGARLLRLSPGQTDLTHAATIQLGDLQVGDRVLVRGKRGADGVSLEAASVLVMKQGEIAQRNREEMLDWQRRGVGGLVQQVDAQAGTVTLLLAGSSQNGPQKTELKNGKTLVIRATPRTTYRRYSSDSVKWEDATASQLGEIRSGNQLRAKGNRSADGLQLEAEEMVFGAFRNIAGLITSIDPAKGTLTVVDLAAKNPVTVQVTGDYQMRKLPPQLAQGLARRLRGESGSEADQAVKGPAGTERATAAAPRAVARSGDLNQMLARLPAATLTEFHKGEAVMIVSTAGSPGRVPQVIILLGGAEPILRGDPGGRNAEWVLTPWSLASAPGGEQP